MLNKKPPQIFVRHGVNFTNRFFVPIFKLMRSREILEGSYIKQFEDAFAKYIGVKHAFSVSSGRMGLYLALQALDLKRDDEIIIPDYTLYAVPALVKAYGLKPIFVDICSQTYNIDISLIEKYITSKTKAILATHLFGQPCEIGSILEIALKYGLKVIEDCAQSCGAEYRGRKVGAFGDAAFFSFNIGKNLCCFGGGMLVTNNDSLWERINHIKAGFEHQKKSKLLSNLFKTTILAIATSQTFFPYTLYPILRTLDFLQIDFLDRLMEEKVVSPPRTLPRYKTKLSNLQAMVGLLQLGILDTINDKMRRNGELITRQLSGIRQIKLPLVISDAKPIYLYYKIEVKKRERVRKLLLKRGIDTKSDDMFACSMLDIFKDCKSNCPVSKDVHLHSLEIPNALYLEEKDIAYICEQIKEVINEI